MDEPVTTEHTDAVEDLKKAVHELSANVIEFKKGAVDRDTVANIVSDMFEKQQAADETAPRRSVTPPDTLPLEALGKVGAARFEALHTTRAAAVAPLVRESAEEIAHFQSAGDKLLLISAIRDVDPRATKFYNDSYRPLLEAAVNTQNVGEGADWVPTELSPTLIDRVELQLKVMALFQSMPMPTQPYELPGRAVSRKKLGQGVENDADTAQTLAKKIQIASRKVTMSAKKFWGEALVSKEAEEDAIMAQLPLIEDELQRYMRFDLEDTGINGDTAGAQDTGWAADDPRKNWDGLRKLALAAAKTDFAGAKLNVSGLRGNRKKMGRYGVDPLELAHILSINAYIDLLDDTSLLTLEKYGPQATILKGELGSVDSIPVIVSEAVRTDLNVTGVFDNVTKTRTEAITVYRPGFAVGERRGLTIEILRELYSEADQDAVKISVRRAFTAIQPATTEPIVSVLYNVNI
jgi:HK97 family phage major capsid protein